MVGHEEVPSGTNVLGPGAVRDVSFSGVSTEYLVDVPGLGTLSVFAQNLDGGVRARRGDTVSLAWQPRHTFVLAADGPADAGVKEAVSGAGAVATVGS